MSVLNIQITDKAGAYIEHSMVISNFLIKVGSQMQDKLCRIFGDNVQYKREVNGEEKTVIPDASINCRFRNNQGYLLYRACADPAPADEAGQQISHWKND